VDYVGLGSDFDGVAYMPSDLDNVSRFVDITVELINRHFFLHIILAQTAVRNNNRIMAVQRVHGR
jgi:microsomal dipeptidase-like Zn-dependent dipeptidase